MKRSLHITIVLFVLGLLLTSSVIHAQTDDDTMNSSIREHPPGCESTSSSKHSFIVKLHDEISSAVEKIKSAIIGSGGSFEGDRECGCFQGKSVIGLIKGEYRSISDTEVEITIGDKPFILPYKTIESRIKKYLI